MTKGGAICTGGAGGSAGVEVPSHEGRGGDPVAPAAKGRIDTGEKVVEMGGDNPHRLSQDSRGTAAHKGHQKHCPRQELDRDLDHVERGFPASVILGIGVDKGQDQCCSPISDLSLRETGLQGGNSPDVKTNPPRKQPAVSC